MKIRDFVHKICEKCRLIHRHGRITVICSNPRHKETGIIFLKFLKEWLRLCKNKRFVLT